MKTGLRIIIVLFIAFIAIPILIRIMTGGGLTEGQADIVAEGIKGGLALGFIIWFVLWIARRKKRNL